jgi:hypothetical protein
MRLIVLLLGAFRINMWNRAKERRFLRHRLCSRIKDDQPQGYATFDWESILHGNAGILGDYKELAVLPDNIARYLYEYHADSYASHGLPPLPRTEAILMCIGSARLHRLYPYAVNLLYMTYDTYFTYVT